MKKLTFIEALKVNETRAVKHITTSDFGLWFDVGEMIKSDAPICKLAKWEWTTEPERFEFECEWDRVNGLHIAPFLETPTVLEKLVGKRTKVTVEVIDE